ncbi:MAG: translation elongation factor Ts [Candidatus Omnitrophota bacterium]
MEKTIIKISAKEIQKLRETTSAGVMDCKSALEEAKGNFDQAMQLLRKKGQVKAAKKVSRSAKEGLIESYVHSNNRIGVLVEVNCETDFVSRCEDFRQFAKDVAMQIAALSPLYIKREDVPKKIAEENKDCQEEFYKKNCLLEQAFIKDPSRTINDYLTDLLAKIGENIVVRRFTRYQLGEES